MKIIKRISRILALIVVYIMAAYGYLTAKGFIFVDGTPVLSNTAQAKDEFAIHVEGDVLLGEKQKRVWGDEKAPLTIYAFSSMACSHCNDFHQFIYPKLERDFVKTGKVRFIFIHFPIDAVSMRAAKLSYCLPPEKYEDFISALYKKRDWFLSGKDKTLNKYAQDFGMNETDIKICDDDKKLTSDILLTFNNAIKTFGISGTPSFIVEGKSGKDLIRGSRNYDDLKEYLNNRINKG